MSYKLSLTLTILLIIIGFVTIYHMQTLAKPQWYQWTVRTTLWLCACVPSSFSRVWLFATPWSVAHQAALSMGFPRWEYWSGLPCPPPGDLPDPGIEPLSPALQVDSFPLSHWEPAMATFISISQMRKLRQEGLGHSSKSTTARKRWPGV